MIIKSKTGRRKESLKYQNLLQPCDEALQEETHVLLFVYKLSISHI